ncbi:MAG: TIGR02281 family clan AA aspartic protease [Pseudomonadota bacterium]|nr:TIGR02281 family clan AA aspartic protease [Pseudomonadota bacterium]
MQKELVLNLTNYPFDKVYQTTNGIVRGAPVKLNKVTIGPIVATDVRASVNGMEMTSSLLGMSFLSSIRGYEVVGDTLTLKRY